MTRNLTYSALVLRVRPSGDANREAWFLTAEEGIIRATVFGGPKSRLRAHVAPFHRGKLWIYHDPVKDNRKVTDFDVLAWRPGLRERYGRSAAAAAVAETILASHGGGGNWPEALSLADAALEALDGAEERFCGEVTLRFLWDWAELLGIRPELNRCASCACEAPGDGVLWYLRREGVLLCSSCLAAAGGDASAEFDAAGTAFPVGPGARRWLSGGAALRTASPGRYTMDGPSGREAAALVTELLSGALGKRLATWDEVW
jgi:DNA repair protein RecO (recombination protein O)